MPTVLLIDVPAPRALGLEERLAVDGCLVRRATGWPADGLDATDVDVVLAHTANPAALALALRRLSRAPLVMVTDAAPTDRVAALTCGADVCLAETEADPVVEAHVMSLLRRWQPRVRHQLETVQVGELFLDPPGRRAQVAGDDLELRPREFDLLVALARSTGRAFRRHELLDQVWGPRFTGGVNTGAGAIYTRLGAPAGASMAADIAAVATYIRSAWGNKGGPVGESDVAAIK